MRDQLKNCKRCRFWDITDEVEDRQEVDFRQECRRFPPVFIDAFMRGDKDVNDPPADACMFPITFASEWCGEFQPR
jgi:hypothetical protein